MYSFLHTKPISWSNLITYPRWRCPARWSTWRRVLGSVHAPSRRGTIRTWWLSVWCRAKRWWDLALPVRVCWLLSAWLLSHRTEPRRRACISQCGTSLSQPSGRAGVCASLILHGDEMFWFCVLSAQQGFASRHPCAHGSFRGASLARAPQPGGCAGVSAPFPRCASPAAL
jgi:hypothetical protein